MTDIYTGPSTFSFPMRQHDERDALQRWFEDWRCNRFDAPPYDTQWMTVEEKKWADRKGREHVRYIGHIGICDDDKPSRTVEFERGAPPPPVFRLEVKNRPVPVPEPRSQHQRRQGLAPPGRFFEDDSDCMTAGKLQRAIDSVNLQMHRSMFVPPWYLQPHMPRIEMDYEPLPPPKFTGRNQ